MLVKLIYHTPDYHKLVEVTARECYQSYDKINESSHNFIRGILDKGHVSISSVGNMVFSITWENDKEYIDVATELLLMKEINNYIRWTLNPEDRFRILLSMNILTFMDIYKSFVKGDYWLYSLFPLILREVSKVKELIWFVDREIELPPSKNTYAEMVKPDFYKPVILSDDYTALKRLGLTPRELDIHATITVSMMVDRASDLQFWRHSDMTGGCELSQRYVDRSNAELRDIVSIEKENPPNLIEFAIKNNLSVEEAKQLYYGLLEDLMNRTRRNIEEYHYFKEQFVKMGLGRKRSNELARNLLPPNVSTRITQCRPLRQWKHLFNLRDSVHAQIETRFDTKAIKEEFIKKGIEVE